MEYLVAALALLLAVAYGVLIAVGIEKGKSWAVETARAISMLDPQHTSLEFRVRALETEPRAPEPDTAPEPETIDRLAA